MAILTRKTTTTYPVVGFAFDVQAHESAMLVHGEAPRLADHHHIDGGKDMDSPPEPGLTIKIKGIGDLYLSPAEVRAIVEGREKVLDLAKNGGNYIARGVRFSR